MENIYSILKQAYNKVDMWMMSGMSMRLTKDWLVRSG